MTAAVVVVVPLAVLRLRQARVDVAIEEASGTGGCVLEPVEATARPCLSAMASTTSTGHSHGG